MAFKTPVNQVTPTTSTHLPHPSPPCVPNEEQFYKMLQSFPKHDTIKLKEDTFIRWQHQLKLIVDAYRLIEYTNGSLSTPPQFLIDSEGRFTSNIEFVSFHQQDKLLASWLLSTISGELLSSFTGTSIT